MEENDDQDNKMTEQDLEGHIDAIDYRDEFDER